MTLGEIQELVTRADVNAGHYESASRDGSAYTVWREFRRLNLMRDDEHDEGWRFQIDRFTKREDDPVVDALFRVLDGDDRIAYEYLVDYEHDTRWIHHIFDCECC